MTRFAFELRGIHPQEEWCALIFVRVYKDGMLPKIGDSESTRTSPIGYIVIIEPERPDPKYKLPAGHKKVGEDPCQTALRELEGETGIRASLDHLAYVNHWQQKGREGLYLDILFTADVEESEQHFMNSDHHENEGEVPHFFLARDFLKLARSNQFMHKHCLMLQEHGLLPA